MNENKRVIIRNFDGVYCLVRVRRSFVNPAHWIFEVSDGGCIRIFKRYASGNYYWVDTFWGIQTPTCIKCWFPAWDFRKILAAVDAEVIE